MNTQAKQHQGVEDVAHQDEKGTSPGSSLTARGARKAPSAFRTISEVADELDVQQHVLRFWETKFSQVKPLKRGGGRRYYRPEDVALLRRIHHLLYTEGYTIKGVQKLMKGQGRQQAAADAPAPAEAAPVPAVTAQDIAAVSRPAAADVPAQGKPLTSNQRAILETMLDELKDLREMING